MPLHDQMIHQGCWMTTEPAEEYIVLAGLRKNWPKKSTEPAEKCLYLPKFTLYRLKSVRNRPKLYRTDQTLHCLGRKTPVSAEIYHVPTKILINKPKSALSRLKSEHCWNQCVPADISELWHYWQVWSTWNQPSLTQVEIKKRCPREDWTLIQTLWADL